MKYAAVLGRDRRPLGRCLFRLRLLARLAEHAERARQVSRAEAQGRRARNVLGEQKDLAAGLDDGRVKRFLAHVWKKEKLSGAESPRDHEPLHGGHLRSRSARAARLPPAVQSRKPARRSTSAGATGAATTRSTWSRATAPTCKSLRGIYIDCGWRDQYHIHYGTRILSKRLAAAGIRHRYEEFDDDHSDIDYRMDVSLPFLYRALR